MGDHRDGLLRRCLEALKEQRLGSRCGNTAMPTWRPNGRNDTFVDTVIPGYSGYIPKARRDPGLALGKVSITSEPWLGENIVREHSKKVMTRKRTKHSQKQASSPSPAPAKESMHRSTPNPVEAQLAEEVERKNREAIKRALAPVVGPRPQTPLADQEAHRNAHMHGGWYSVPSGIYPPPITRYPPTHRSGDRLRWPKGRTVEETAAKDLNYDKNRETIARQLNDTMQKRVAEAEEKKRARAERERQLKKARGIIKEGDKGEGGTRRNAKRAEVTQEDMYNNPDAFPCGRPHGCLFMTLYPAREDVKPGEIRPTL